MKNILCRQCNKYTKLKDIEVRKDLLDGGLFGGTEKCWCPMCGAQIPLDPEAVEGANPLFLLVTLVCLVFVLVVGFLPKPYSTIFALLLTICVGSLAFLRLQGSRKFFGILLVAVSVYLAVTLPIKF